MPRRRPTGPIPPCCVCGDAEGRGPQRIALARFGIAGRACRPCYSRLEMRERQGRPITPPEAMPYGCNLPRRGA